MKHFEVVETIRYDVRVPDDIPEESVEAYILDEVSEWEGDLNIDTDIYHVG